MNLKTNFFLISCFTMSLFAEQQFNDTQYIIEKSTLAQSIKEINSIKKRFTIGSNEYILLNHTEQELLKKLPIDAFDTYSRIKLKNILQRNIDEQIKELPKPDTTLRADTDLNYLYESRFGKSNETVTNNLNQQEQFVNSNTPIATPQDSQLQMMNALIQNMSQKDVNKQPTANGQPSLGIMK